MGVYRYAPKLFVDWLTEMMPEAYFCTKIPADRHAPPADGRPIVQIGTVPASAYSNKFLARRWLTFVVVADTEMQAGDTIELVRHFVIRRARWARICRSATMVGEPGRFDLDDETVPQMRMTIEALFRESYPPRILRRVG